MSEERRWEYEDEETGLACWMTASGLFDCNGAFSEELLERYLLWLAATADTLKAERDEARGKLGDYRQAHRESIGHINVLDAELAEVRRDLLSGGE